MENAVRGTGRNADRAGGKRGARRRSGSTLGGAVCLFSALVVSCVAESSPSTESTATGSPSWSGGGSSSGSATATDAAVPPMVVDLDPGGTLVATPGSGIGVFTEYESGGHWRVWWTCDTTITGQPCEYEVVASVADGAITNLDGIDLEAGDELVQQQPNEVLAWTHTTTGRDEVGFDAPAGTAMELEVSLDPAPDKNFLFFVQNGQVNGGYQGSLTNPLILQPSSP